MKVLDKHPVPWRLEHGVGGGILDANGVRVAWSFESCVGEDDGTRENVERIILAAPELLESLKALNDAVEAEPDTLHSRELTGALIDASALIARIEGGK